MNNTFVTVPAGTTHVIGINGKKYQTYIDFNGTCTVEMPHDCAAALVKSDPVIYQIIARVLGANSPAEPVVQA